MHPCYLGVDMATYKELIAANLTVDQIRDARRRRFARLPQHATGWSMRPAASARDFCLGCLTGKYPSSPVVAMPDADRQPALKL